MTFAYRGRTVTSAEDAVRVIPAEGLARLIGEHLAVRAECDPDATGGFLADVLTSGEDPRVAVVRSAMDTLVYDWEDCGHDLFGGEVCCAGLTYRGDA